MGGVNLDYDEQVRVDTSIFLPTILIFAKLNQEDFFYGTTKIKFVFSFQFVKMKIDVRLNIVKPPLMQVSMSFIPICCQSPDPAGKSLTAAGE